MSNNDTSIAKANARRLVDYEAASGKPVVAKDPVASRVCEKLRGPLGKLMGIGGFYSLLSRAQALASAEVPWLLDLNMPKKNGWEVLQEVKGDSDLRTIPIMVLTSSNHKSDIERSYGLGADCYMIKPPDFLQTVSFVESLKILLVKCKQFEPSDCLNCLHEGLKTMGEPRVMHEKL